jgi:nucleotide-binding universal stress UspA family protein
VQYGSARGVVEKAVDKVEPDLLVLGTHGYSGLAYVFLGTVAGDLLRAAKCDVLMVPPRKR